MLRQISSNRGSTTVEAIFIVSLVIIIVSVIVFSFLVMYQKIMLFNFASSTAEKAAISLLNNGKKLKEDDLDKSTIKGFIDAKDLKVDIKYEGDKFVKVIVSQDISVPFGGVKKAFSGKSTITLTEIGTVKITSPTRNIRNVDLFIETIVRAVYFVKDNIIE